MNIFLSVFIFLFYIIATGCNTSNIQDNVKKKEPINKDLYSIKSEETLKALINFSATSYFLYKGNPMGFEYELLKRYTDHIGLELEVIPIKNIDIVFTYLNGSYQTTT